MVSIPLFSAPLRTITQEEIRRYEEDGVVLLKGIYPAAWLSFLEQAVDDVFAREASNKVYTKAKAQQDSVTTGNRMLIDAEVAAKVGSERIAMQIPGVVPKGRNIVETGTAMWHEAMRQHHVQGPLPEIVAQLCDLVQ